MVVMGYKAIKSVEQLGGRERSGVAGGLQRYGLKQGSWGRKSV